MITESPIGLNPDGIERPSFRGSLEPNGSGVLLDRQVILAASKDKDRLIILILAKPSLNIARTELIESDGPITVFPTHDGLSRFRLFLSTGEDRTVRVGQQYLISFNNHTNSAAYTVESTHPIEHEEVSERQKRFNQQLKNILWPQRTLPRPISGLRRKNALNAGRR